MNAIEVVIVSFITFIVMIVCYALAYKKGLKDGHKNKETDIFIYRNYPTYKHLRAEKVPEDEIVANLLFEGTEEQCHQLKAFYNKYDEKLERERAEEFKKQFNKPIGEKIVDSLPFK